MGCRERFIEDGKVVERDCHSGGPPQQTAPERGPGTELKKLLAKIGITATPNCKCNSRVKHMDAMEAQEPGWCERNIDTIVGYLREAAAERKLPFVDMAGRVLVKRAIANARRKGADAGRPPHHD